MAWQPRFEPCAAAWKPGALTTELSSPLNMASTHAAISKDPICNRRTAYFLSECPACFCRLFTQQEEANHAEQAPISSVICEKHGWPTCIPHWPVLTPIPPIALAFLCWRQ